MDIPPDETIPEPRTSIIPEGPRREIYHFQDLLWMRNILPRLADIRAQGWHKEQEI